LILFAFLILLSPIDQNEILIEVMLLEFFQTAPEKEVPEISEESLFS
jgi:hypothetical protein